MISTYLRYFLTTLKNRLGIISYPSLVTFIVTWRCNQRCIMCDIWKKKKTYEMSVEEIDTIFSQLKPLDAIRITGGEPFLRDDITEIVNLINEQMKPIIIHITTNGTLPERIVAFIKNARNLLNVHIKISIDALEEEHDRIRGGKGSYNKAMSTLSELSGLSQKYGFYLGVNQTIVSQKCLDDYNNLQEICNKYNVKLYPVLAYSKPPLYEPNNCLKPNQKMDKTDLFGNFSREKIIKLFNVFKKDATKLDNFIERIVKKYYLNKLSNCLIYGKNYSNPRCVALRSHLRILPNGDVPICLYNSTIVGNLLKEQDFKRFWFSNKNIEKYRKIISQCSGCWAECEIVPNGIYTGDIIKYIL